MQQTLMKRRKIMDNKEHLINFIDAVISEDSDATKTSFSSYAEAKIKELAGVAPKQETLKEHFDRYLLEVELNDDIELTQSNKVLVKGKEVGKLITDGKSEVEDESDFVFVTNNGERFPIPDNDVEKLINVIEFKFLGGQKPDFLG